MLTGEFVCFRTKDRQLSKDNGTKYGNVNKNLTEDRLRKDEKVMICEMIRRKLYGLTTQLQLQRLTIPTISQSTLHLRLTGCAV
jgi:hypothetical protein